MLVVGLQLSYTLVTPENGVIKPYIYKVCNYVTNILYYI